ncbi:MAG TPA: cation diffusion facilitator family transporter, partial [Gammaproteobacteria bacterium]
MSDTHHHQHGSERRLLWALLLIGGFMLVEVVGGLLSGSLALLADAGHMLTDAASLFLAWAASRAASRPADALRTYGYHRVQILAALLNGLAFILLVGWIAYEAFQRLMQPVEVLGGIMLVIAVLGLLVNVAAFAILHGGDDRDLNLRGAVIHVLGDLLGSVAAIVAAGVILLSGWMPIDPLLSLLVALLILRSAWSLVKKSAHILLEGTPEDVDVELLRQTIREGVAAVEDVHHVHVWSLTPQRPLLTMHVTVADTLECAPVLAQVKQILKQRFGITHSTIQVEAGGCA